MASLGELLGSGETRPRVVSDACEVLDAEVADKGGLTGIAIKGAFGVLKGIKPGFVPEVVEGLLDDFLGALDPLYQEAVTKGVKPGHHLNENRDRMAELLLAVTDRRAQRAERMVIKKTYDKLRPTAKKHVEAAGPRLAELLDRHVK